MTQFNIYPYYKANGKHHVGWIVVNGPKLKGRACSVLEATLSEMQFVSEHGWSFEEQWAALKADKRKRDAWWDSYNPKHVTPMQFMLSGEET